MKIFLTIILFLSTPLICSRADAGECDFGTELSSLIDQTNLGKFAVKFLGNFVKIARSEIEGTVVRVKIYEIGEVESGRLFHLNFTYEDEFDGGNSLGWIEDVETLAIVARVQDSTFYDCHLR